MFPEIEICDIGRFFRLEPIRALSPEAWPHPIANKDKGYHS
jgi:hypothetical protein